MTKEEIDEQNFRFLQETQIINLQYIFKPLQKQLDVWLIYITIDVIDLISWEKQRQVRQQLLRKSTK